jgi:hypothetical protein
MTSWGTAVEDSSTQLVSYLRPGEQLLWSGRPDPSMWFSPADVFLVPFSIMWGGFAVVWELGALVSGAGPFFALWGIPFVAVGLYMMFGRFIYKHRTKLRTAYGLTPDRALVAVGTKALNDSPLKQTPSSIRRSRDECLFVVKSFFGQVVERVLGVSWWRLRGASYARCGSGSGFSEEPAVGVQCRSRWLVQSSPLALTGPRSRWHRRGGVRRARR